MTSLTLGISVTCLLLSLVVLFANPRRFPNVILSCVALVASAWLACVYRAMVAGDLHGEARVRELEVWFRANAIIISLFPASVWALRAALLNKELRLSKILLSAWPGVFVSVCCVVLACGKSFLYVVEGGHIERGLTYYGYISLHVLAYVILACGAFHRLRLIGGLRRVEIQLIVLSLSAFSLIAALLSGAGNFSNLRILSRAAVFAVLIASVLICFSVVFHRILNAQEAAFKALRRCWFLVLVVFVGYVTWSFFSRLAAQPFDLLLSIAVGAPLTLWVDARARSWVNSITLRRILRIRRSAKELARLDREPAELIEDLEALLSIEFNSTGAKVLADMPGAPNATFDEVKCSVSFATLCHFGWATPESLQRRKPNLDLLELTRLMERHNLGLLLVIAAEVDSPSLILGLEPRRDGSPYTYPEIERIRSAAEEVDRVLAQARVAKQAEMRAELKGLPWMSRGLVHDLKNIITPVKSYLDYLDLKFKSDEAELTAGAPARRSVKLFQDYLSGAVPVGDSAESRFEVLDLGQVLSTSWDVLKERARSLGVSFSVELPQSVFVKGNSSLLQRMFGNLVDNALEASKKGQSVEVVIQGMDADMVRIRVVDHGPGIPREHLGKLFETRFTTKTSAATGSGHGLGLAISQKIASLHKGRITVESEVGKGAAFTVWLPRAVADKSIGQEFSASDVTPDRGRPSFA